ncbi:synapsin-1-like [Bos mutus]|uniref:synapsin-1-like n=1 Tax=Bos mutus TaxID=72004 RepID=UPI0038B43A0B
MLAAEPARDRRADSSLLAPGRRTPPAPGQQRLAGGARASGPPIDGRRPPTAPRAGARRRGLPRSHSPAQARGPGVSVLAPAASAARGAFASGGVGRQTNGAPSSRGVSVAPRPRDPPAAAPPGTPTPDQRRLARAPDRRSAGPPHPIAARPRGGVVLARPPPNPFGPGASEPPPRAWRAGGQPRHLSASPAGTRKEPPDTHHPARRQLASPKLLSQSQAPGKAGRSDGGGGCQEIRGRNTEKFETDSKAAEGVGPTGRTLGACWPEPKDRGPVFPLFGPGPPPNTEHQTKGARPGPGAEGFPDPH